VMALNRVECRRCGFKWVVSPAKKDAKDLLCKSCRVKPATVVQKGEYRCEAWQGEVDDDLNPVDANGLYMPGERVCGMKDCVNEKHIVSSEL